MRRRIAGFRAAGIQVVGFMARRGGATAPSCRIVDLGRTYDNAYLHRLAFVVRGARIAAREAEELTKADLICARNLDMLACAVLARRRLGLKTPILYECLDIHHRLSASGLLAAVLRRLERALLRRTSLVAISSPGFEREYFARHHRGVYRAALVENRLAADPPPPPRPVHRTEGGLRDRPLRLGWFGNLRCSRSLRLMQALSDRFGGRLEIHLRGYPARGVFPDFEKDIADHRAIRFHGAYGPADLAAIYSGVDLIWAGDFYEAGANSMWLLPNRLYEGGYFGVPPVAPAETETGRWIAEREVGFPLPDPVERSLPCLVERLLADPAPATERRRRLLSMPASAFVEDPADLSRILESAMLAPAVDPGRPISL